MVAQMETYNKPEALTSLRVSSDDNNQRPPSLDSNNLNEICTMTLHQPDASNSAHDLRVMMLQPFVKHRLTFLKCFVRNLQNNDSCVEEIAKNLLAAECWLSDVILLQNVPLTRAFLKEKESTSNANDECCFVPPEIVLLRNLRLKSAFPSADNSSIIDGDSQTSVNLVMSSLDVNNARVIFKHGPCKDDRVRYFFENLASMATKQLNLKALKVFVEQLAIDILDDEASRLIELEIFQKASMEAIEIFLNCKIDAQVAKLFKRNILTALFGNPNVSLGFLKKLKFDVDARGIQDSTALHYAMKNSLFDKVKFLLDCGAEPNSINWRNETPLVLALNEPQVNAIDNKQCAELLLQFGADPFLSSWEGQSFDSCIQPNFTSTTRYLMELAMAHVRVYKASGAANLSTDICNALKGIDILVKENHHLFSFYMMCKQQLRMLKGDRIRGDLSMFTIVSTTGEKLVRLLDENDRRIVTRFITEYKREKTLHPYYLDALKEHMRQFRRLVTCKNRAILVLSEILKVSPAHCHIALNEIAGYLTSKDLLVFQLGYEKSASSCKRPVSRGTTTIPKIKISRC